MTLTSKDKRKLHQQAHHLKPVIIIGSKGLTDEVQKEIDLALEAHELIKIKVNDHDKSDIKEMLPMICEANNAQDVQFIGHTIVIWRKKKD